MCLCVMSRQSLSKRPSSFCLIHFGGNSGAAQGWKPTFDGRHPLMEDDLWWKTTFDGRRSLMEEDLWWKTTFGGRQPPVEDDLRWKMTFNRRQPSMEEDLRWTMTFDERGHIPFHLNHQNMLTSLNASTSLTISLVALTRGLFFSAISFSRLFL